MKINFKNWLLSEESRSFHIDPHFLETLESMRAFVFTMNQKYYEGNTHEEICGINKNELEKEYGDKILFCDTNDDLFLFSLVGRFATIENDKSIESLAYRVKISTEDAKIYKNKTIISFWNSSGFQHHSNKKMYSTQELFSKLLVPCIKKIISEKSDHYRHHFKNPDDVYVSISGQEPKKASFYLGGGSYSAENKVDRPTDKTSEILAFHKKKWPDGTPLSPDEYEKLQKKYGPPPSRKKTSDTTAAVQKPQKKPFIELLRLMVNKKIFTPEILFKIMNIKYPFIFCPESVDDAKLKNLNIINSTNKTFDGAIDEVLEPFRVAAENKYNRLLGYYEKAFKNAQYAVEGDNRKGFTGIVCGQISTYNPEIANIVDDYDDNPLILGRSIVLINPKHTSSFLYSKNQFYQSLKGMKRGIR